jgi:ubiquinone/menaquinone biosynthesis C-methylase UbiE
MEDEFNLEAKFCDKIWGKYDYDADVKFLDDLFKEHDYRSVIDVGCGTGNHAIRLSRLGYEVTGVDISPTMLKIAKEKDKEAKISFIQADIKELEGMIPKGQKFDAAICPRQTFSHLITNRDVQAFLNGLHKILKRNGLFIFNARNARIISEDYLNRLLLDHMIMEEKLQLLLLFYNTRHPRNRNVIIWRPIYLMKESDKVDLQMREHKLRWFDFSRLKKMLIENGFKVTAIYSETTKEEFKEDKHTEMWFVTITK